MRNKLVWGIVVLALAGGLYGGWRLSNTKNVAKEVIKLIRPEVKTMQTVVETTGTVLPQNRLEILPPVSGRIDEILVKEGDRVQKGKVVAWMSSTERAALLDAARAQGPEKLMYWQEVYKATPLISPIDGEVIGRLIEPGQTVNSATAILVISDRLIVKAEVDESDIGKVKVGAIVDVNPDAYPDNHLPGKVTHIAYESSLMNNVNIYQVEILLDQRPAYLRSGMGATVKIIIAQHDQVLVLPLEAVKSDGLGNYVFLSDQATSNPERRKVLLGLADEKNVEIIQGVRLEDSVIITDSKYNLPKRKSGTNPFMPQRGRR